MGVWPGPVAAAVVVAVLVDVEGVVVAAAAGSS